MSENRVRHVPLQLIVVVLFVAGLPALVDATPRFAARTGERCSRCHVNPTGGGPRTRYGRNVFEKQYLSVDWPKSLDVGADTEIGFADDTFTAAVGSDVRLAYLFSEPGAPTPTNQGMNTFFLMQADFYLTAELTDYATLSLDVGKSRLEAYGMLHTAGRDYWLKAGQFVMPYGLRYPNHKLFVRSTTGFNPAGDYRGLDAGLEAGASFGPINAIVAVANGKPPGGTSDLDANDSKAVYAKLEYVLGGDGLKLRAGLSGATNFAGRRIIETSGNSAEVVQDNRVQTRQAGAYVTSSLGRFTYTGEVDVTQTVEFDTTQPSPGSFETRRDESLGYSSYQELSFLPVQGLDLQAIVEYRDPSLEFTGRSETRVGGGFEFFPMPMVEWKLLYRHTFARDLPGDGTNELFTYLHFYL